MSERPSPPTKGYTRAHHVVWDPSWSAERWTCTHCGRAVLRYNGNVYGSAVDQPCGDRL